MIAHYTRRACFLQLGRKIKGHAGRPNAGAHRHTQRAAFVWSMAARGVRAERMRPQHMRLAIYEALFVVAARYRGPALGGPSQLFGEGSRIGHGRLAGVIEANIGGRFGVALRAPFEQRHGGDGR